MLVGSGTITEYFHNLWSTNTANWWVSRYSNYVQVEVALQVKQINGQYDSNQQIRMQADLIQNGSVVSRTSELIVNPGRTTRVNINVGESYQNTTVRVRFIGNGLSYTRTTRNFIH